MELNAAFVSRTVSLFGEDRYSRFARALEKEPVVSVRYNVSKMEPDNSLERVPWADNGRYLPNRPVFTADPRFHAGCYYVQEASSMFLEQVVKKYVTTPVRALDLCAAPGGKTTHLLSILPSGSLLVSNEPMPLRAQVLAENVMKWGNAASVVTRNEPADFAPFRHLFDLVVVDAPCSGEGMFRKDAFAVEQWSEANVELCARRQKEILSSIWGSLRPGGLLVYSTCTFNSEENEECVAWIAEELGADVLPLDVAPEWGVTGALSGTYPVFRFIPGFTSGEGFFLAVLRKDGDAPAAQPRAPRMQRPVSKVMCEAGAWLNEAAGFEFVQQGDNLLAMPREHAATMLALQQRLRVLHCGIPLAGVKNGKLLPMHGLAMSTSFDKGAFPVVELGLEQALAYLHRETLSLPQAPMGHLLLTYEGTPLGFAKNVGNRANNLYPAEWRIRKNPMEL